MIRVIPNWFNRAYWWLVGLLKQSFIRPEFGTCPWCGYQHDCEGLIVKWHEGGNYHDGETTIYWASGIAECPLCGHRFEYSDSSD